jgi:hypothetical protein
VFRTGICRQAYAHCNLHITSKATLYAGTTKQFTATISGTSNSGVTWSATVGIVTSNGLYTAPIVTATKTAYVTATTVTDTHKKGERNGHG